ncbi:MAG TPA: methionine biosynthesis protein MetW [Elusimicrobiota bacterium]|nr:methionine biosynthesis protein MetW [Elusimicrobiota bacterium]
MANVRPDHAIVAGMVETGARVLDLGCGDGELMAVLQREKNAKVEGVELDEQSIYQCVAKGLSVLHSDFARGLSSYPDGSFDYVILNQSLQEVRHVDWALTESFRVGRGVIVGFPNFGLWSARCSYFFSGRTPVTRSLPHRWYDTPNVRFLTVTDFKDYCRDRHYHIVDASYLNDAKPVRWRPNLFASLAIIKMMRNPA